MRKHLLLTFPVLTATALAQFAPLPAPNLELRVAPRATWSAVISAGTNTTGTTFRCDVLGAASNDTMYVFGGCLNNNTSTTVNDLWAFDAVAGTFTQVHDGLVSTAPHARGRASVAWNPNSNKLVVFGGDNRATGPLPADTLLNDTWEYAPVTNTWTDVTPASSPSPRRWAGMAFEPITGGMLLFGGDTGAGVPSSETWLFLGGSWLQMTPANTPGARRMASMMTRSDFGDVLMCGGEDTVNYLPDTYRFLDVWTWNGTNWTKISDYDWVTSTGTFPASAMANQAVYDPIRQRVVMQSGQGIAANTAANVTYLYGTTVYNGSPTNYTSEFDCMSNTWSIYASSLATTAPYNNNDPQIGRISRYYAAYIPATGKVYKACGQNPANSGSKPTYNVYEYQANPVANATSYGAGCTGPGGVLTLTSNGAPWTNRTWHGTCTNMGPLSFGLTLYGFSTAAVPLDLVLPGFGGAGCVLLNSAEAMLGPDLPTLGNLTINLPVANTPSLAGIVLNAQVAQLDFALSTLWTSNGVTLTIGAL